jgi:hypothetical protein
LAGTDGSAFGSRTATDGGADAAEVVWETLPEEPRRWTGEKGQAVAAWEKPVGRVERCQLRRGRVMGRWERVEARVD